MAPFFEITQSAYTPYNSFNCSWNFQCLNFRIQRNFDGMSISVFSTILDSEDKTLRISRESSIFVTVRWN